MAQVSSRQLSEKVHSEITSIFLEVLSSLKTSEDTAIFLKDFLTPTEKIVLAKRLAIAFMLKKKYSYESIRSILKVSAPTIASVNLRVKFSGKGYNKVLDKLLKYEKINDIFDKVETALLNTLTIGRGKGTGVWRELKKKKSNTTMI